MALVCRAYLCCRDNVKYDKSERRFDLKLIVCKDTFPRKPLHSTERALTGQTRLDTVNSKSFVGKVLLRIKSKFELNYTL